MYATIVTILLLGSFNPAKGRGENVSIVELTPSTLEDQPYENF